MISGCPMNRTLLADNTTSTTIVSWTPPTVTDNSGDNVTLDVTMGPGSLFSLGVTVVTYTATDAAGLVSTCEFSVTILGELSDLDGLVVIGLNRGEIQVSSLRLWCNTQKSPVEILIIQFVLVMYPLPALT